MNTQKIHNNVPNCRIEEEDRGKFKAISEDDDSEIVSFNLNGPKSYNDGEYFEFQVFVIGSTKNIHVAAGKDTLYVKGTKRTENQTVLFTVLSVVLQNIDLTRYTLPSDCAFYKDVNEVKIMTNSKYTNKIYN